MPNTFTFIICILLIVLSACSETAVLNTPNVDKTFPVAEARPSGPSSTALPPAVNDAPFPGIAQNLPDEPLSGASVFNVSVHEIDAREFFMSLVVDSQENMVVHPDVVGRISLELKNVTIPQVLGVVQKVYGYDYNKTDIGYIIYPATLQTKIFKIDRIDLLREGSSNTRVSSGQISNASRRANALNQAAPSPNNQAGNLPNNSNSGSWITTSSKTDFWDELQLSLAAIVDAGPVADNAAELHNPQTDSKVVINKQTGIVVVRTNPSQMREVEKLIESIQGQINRQVVIEAKILEIILDDEHQDGVNWATVMRDAEFAMLSSVNPLPMAASVSSQVFTIGVNSGDFYAFIELMQGQGKTNILSSPRISTLNNQKAVIKVGQDEYFITDIASNTTASTTTTVTQDITWTPFFSGIALDVTPQISDRNNITLHIHPSITRVENQTKQFTINDEPNELPMALNTVRESDSIVHAENGQIIVIGGLMQDSRDETKQGVSLLTQIPYLGNVFRENKGRGRKSELVILLKPTIINDGSDWKAPIEESRERMQKLERKQLWK
ncbi:MAG: pilus (MSHA type) biogenesis protein MshL [Methylomonas sp.]|nr:pilus (MSHA type) biogenesis protein MshL [Methylomonas sp.]